MLSPATSSPPSTDFTTAVISVCAKHFPGHGDTSDDTHLGGALVDARSMATLHRT